MKQELIIMSNSIPTNTLRQVKDGDFLTFKGCLDTFMNWYMRECDKLREISEAWMESEDDTLITILSRGLSELQAQTEIVKEVDRV